MAVHSPSPELNLEGRLCREKGPGHRGWRVPLGAPREVPFVFHRLETLDHGRLCHAARKAVEMPQGVSQSSGQDLASPCRTRFLLTGLRPLSWARPQGLPSGWLSWGPCPAPSLPRACQAPRGPTCVPNPGGISSLSDIPLPRLQSLKATLGSLHCDKHVFRGLAHGRGLGNAEGMGLGSQPQVPALPTPLVVGVGRSCPGWQPWRMFSPSCTRLLSQTARS